MQRAIVASKRRKLAVEVKEAKAAEKQAQKELSEAVNRHTKGQFGLQRQHPGSDNVQKARKKQVKPPSRAIIPNEVEEVVLTTLIGRRVQRPRRFAM